MKMLRGTRVQALRPASVVRRGNHVHRICPVCATSGPQTPTFIEEGSESQAESHKWTPSETEIPSTSYEEPGLQGDPGKQVHLIGSKMASISVVEGPRPLEDYMRLPASQYSVLDAQKVERLDAETFRCYVSGITFFWFQVEPVLTLRVQPHESGCDITMLACKLKGSKLVESQNEKFASSMTNKVRWRLQDGQKELVSEASVQVSLQIPDWFVVPKGTVKSTGDKVMQTVLNIAMPKFIAQLESDYQVWSSGDESRTPMGSLDV